VTQLLETTRALFSCELREDVAEVVVDAAERVLGFDVVSVRLYTSATPMTWSSPRPPMRSVTCSASESASAFRERDGRLVPSIRTGHLRGPAEQLAVRLRTASGAMTIPIADHGLLNVGSPVSGAFDDHHVQLAQLLAASAAAALEQTDRREDLLRHERVLETVGDGVCDRRRQPADACDRPSRASWIRSRRPPRRTRLAHL